MTPRRWTAAGLLSCTVAAAAVSVGTPAAVAGPKPSPSPTTSTTTPTTSPSPSPSPTVAAADTSAFNTMYNIGAIVGAHSAHKAGITGKGVDVALIDTGVSPVPGLTSGNVINGPDLSFDSQEPSLTNLDGFGHGTHMASLIVGRDAVQTRPASYVNSTNFTGIAPDARLVSLKVGAADGGVDVTQVLAALNWVAEHGQKDGLNIRVVNLSYGTDTTQDHLVDPLAHAVEALRKKGVVVVVAAGNDGSDKNYLGMPARDPFVIAVGGQNPNGTLSTRDDTVPAFANRGVNTRNVDLIAPAVSVHGLRVPASYADEHYPSARVGERLFKGSGTSQAAAIVSGAAALYLQKYPQAKPDDVKHALLVGTSQITPGIPEQVRGRGALNIAGSLGMWRANVQQGDPSTGTGSLELSRGSSHVVDYPSASTDNPMVLDGERDIFGQPFDTTTWAQRTNAGTTWSADGTWLGRTIAGAGWSGNSWTGRTWTGRTWTGDSWAGRTWTGRTWTGRTWTGRTWTSGSWAGRTWTGRTWTGRTWTGNDWSGTETWQ